jgi:hypothetical protein
MADVGFFEHSIPECAISAEQLKTVREVVVNSTSLVSAPYRVSARCKSSHLQLWLDSKPDDVDAMANLSNDIIIRLSDKLVRQSVHRSQP